jgi:hypothetical protein
MEIIVVKLLAHANFTYPPVPVYPYPKLIGLRCDLKFSAEGGGKDV